MVRYEIRKNDVELKKYSDITEGCTLQQADQEPEILESFGNKEDALEALKKYESSFQKLSGGAGTFYSVTEYYVEENEYDEDGEWCAGGDVWAFAEFRKEE